MKLVSFEVETTYDNRMGAPATEVAEAVHPSEPEPVACGTVTGRP